MDVKNLTNLHPLESNIHETNFSTCISYLYPSRFGIPKFDLAPIL
jgi:hypothetical protein